MPATGVGGLEVLAADAGGVPGVRPHHGDAETPGTMIGPMDVLIAAIALTLPECRRRVQGYRPPPHPRPDRRELGGDGLTVIDYGKEEGLHAKVVATGIPGMHLPTFQGGNRLSRVEITVERVRNYRDPGAE